MRLLFVPDDPAFMPHPPADFLDVFSAPAARDAVNHPTHYNSNPSGVECIVVAEHMSFCLGNTMKYIWRAGHKGDALEDLKKARWYLDREIQRLEQQQKKEPTK